MADSTFDIVVIGGGIAGVSAACELAGAGERVLLVEREGQLAYHTTGRSAALFIEGWGPPTVRRLLTASRAGLESAPDRLGTPELLTLRPSLFVAEEADAADVAALLVEVPELDDIGPDGALDMCPQLRPGVIAAAALQPRSCSIDVMALHQGYVRGVIGHGGQIEKWYDVVGIDRHAAAGFTVTSESGRSVSAGRVVLAAGAWTDILGARAGAQPLGLAPLRRSMAVCPTPVVVEPFGPHVSDINDKYYWQPEGPNIQCSPADETPSEPCDARPEEIDIAYVLDQVNATTTLNLRSVKTSWAGLRTFSPDREPVCGEDPDVAGLWWFCGQGGYGIETCEAMAASIAGLMTVGELPDEVRAHGIAAADLSASRFRV